VKRTEQLDQSASVKLDAQGNGTVALYCPTLETWTVTRTAVSTTTNVLEATAVTYVGQVSPGSQLSGTYSGSLDSSDEQQQINPGQSLLCVWTGGDPGATATLSIFGTRLV
jgi:hypothetical protein